MAASPGSTLSRKSGLLSRSGLISSTSTAPARISAVISPHSSRLAELIVRARMPARAAASTWLRISASSGETMTVGRPASPPRRPRRPQQRGGHEVDRATCPSRCAARRAPAAGRRPAPRWPATGPRAARRARRRAGAAPPRRAPGPPPARLRSPPASSPPRRMSTSRHRQDPVIHRPRRDLSTGQTAGAGICGARTGAPPDAAGLPRADPGTRPSLSRDRPRPTARRPAVHVRLPVRAPASTARTAALHPRSAPTGAGRLRIGGHRPRTVPRLDVDDPAVDQAAPGPASQRTASAMSAAPGPPTSVGALAMAFLGHPAGEELAVGDVAGRDHVRGDALRARAGWPGRGRSRAGPPWPPSRGRRRRAGPRSSWSG